MILADIIVLKSKLICTLLLVINNISKVLKKSAWLALFRAAFTNKKKIIEKSVKVS